VQGLLATFHLVRRQDLLAYTVATLLRGQEDVLELEVGRRGIGWTESCVLVGLAT